MANVIPIMPWPDRPVVIVAGGPSVSLKQIRTIGMARSRDMCRVIAVNDAVYPCWFADILHGCDARWWEDPDNAGVKGFRGHKTSLETTKFPDVQVLRNTGIEGYDDEVGCIRSGSNSGAQAIQIAVKVGAKRIALVGFDFSGEKHLSTGTRDHWFGRHKPGMDKNSDTQEWRRLLRVLTDELERRGISIINCSPGSTIRWLPMADIESVLAEWPRK